MCDVDREVVDNSSSSLFRKAGKSEIRKKVLDCSTASAMPSLESFALHNLFASPVFSRR